jgi:hypothetical protein
MPHAPDETSGLVTKALRTTPRNVDKSSGALAPVQFSTSSSSHSKDLLPNRLPPLRLLNIIHATPHVAAVKPQAIHLASSVILALPEEKKGDTVVPPVAKRLASSNCAAGPEVEDISEAVSTKPSKSPRIKEHPGMART